MVKNPVWRAAGMPNAGSEGDGMLHRLCLEKRLGRELTIKDFPPYPVNCAIYLEYGLSYDQFKKDYEEVLDLDFDAYERQVEAEYKEA